ncbi:unnamed protein product [Brassica rapa subsp. narinosa]
MNEGDSRQKTMPPSFSSLDAGRASGRRRRVLCTAVYSLPSPLAFIAVFISHALVPFASHVAVSSDPVAAVTSSNLPLVAASSPVPLIITAHPITASRSAGSTLLEITGSAHFLAPLGSPFGAQPEHPLFRFSLSPVLAIRCHVSLPSQTLVKNPQRWFQSHRSIGVDIQIVMGLCLCLGSVESNGLDTLPSPVEYRQEHHDPDPKVILVLYFQIQATQASFAFRLIRDSHSLFEKLSWWFKLQAPKT